MLLRGDAVQFYDLSRFRERYESVSARRNYKHKG
jgi:hypothetical protein